MSSLPALRILVVEDHTTTRQLLARMLTRRGFVVMDASCGAEAIRVLTETPCDLVISDLGLPDTDGWSLFNELRRIRPQALGIALSGYGLATDLEKSAKAGFHLHLTKPLTMSRVEEAIGSLFPDRIP